MKVNSINIFLVDGIGALLSLLMLGYVLPFFNEYLNIHPQSLGLLAALAAVFMTYSLMCYQFSNGDKPILLKIIMSLNLLYCVFTVGLLCITSKDITALGIAYFFIEICIILALVYYESRYLTTTE